MTGLDLLTKEANIPSIDRHMAICPNNRVAARPAPFR
jgi:hypothetical protein